MASSAAESEINGIIENGIINSYQLWQRAKYKQKWQRKYRRHENEI
jgi:hypothetical protein